MANDRNARKYREFFQRDRKRRPAGYFLGTRECQGYVEPCVFGDGVGAYDNIPELSFGLMLHGMTYPDEAYSKGSQGMLTSNFGTQSCGTVLSLSRARKIARSINRCAK
ncbi:MAG: type I-E CRISPR-associated protein Cas5/CasD [Hydrogeniiclostridium mannosilyticum]